MRERQNAFHADEAQYVPAHETHFWKSNLGQVYSIFFKIFIKPPGFVWAIWVWGIENQGQKWTINGETNGQNVFFLQLMRMAMGTKKVGAGRDKIQLS